MNIFPKKKRKFLEKTAIFLRRATASPGNITIKHGILRLGLVVHRVEAADILEELVEVGVRGRVDGGLEQRLEQTLDDVLETLDRVVHAVDVVQAGDLDQPSEKQLQILIYINIGLHVRLSVCPYWSLSPSD